MLAYGPRFQAISQELKGMDLEDIDRWVHQQDEQTRTDISLALIGILHQRLPEYSPLNLVRYKQLLRLACHVLPEGELFSLLTALGPEGTIKWPLDLKNFLFIFMDKQLSVDLKVAHLNVAELPDKEQKLIRIHLFRVVQAQKMGKFLLTLVPEKRIDYMREMSLLDLPISAIMQVYGFPEKGSFDKLNKAYEITKNQWVASLGFELSKVTRLALLEASSRKTYDIIESPLMTTLLNLLYAVDLALPIELLRNSCPRERRKRLHNIRSHLMAKKDEINNLLNLIKFDPAELRMRFHVDSQDTTNPLISQALLAVYSYQNALEFCRIDACLTGNRAKYEERVDRLRKDMESKVSEVNEKLKASVLSVKDSPTSDSVAIDFFSQTVSFLARFSFTPINYQLL